MAVKAEDTENGFRWLIERSSFDVKIEQEKPFAQRWYGNPMMWTCPHQCACENKPFLR